MSAVEITPSTSDFDVLQGRYDDAAFGALRARTDLLVYRDHREPLERQAIVIPVEAGFSADGFHPVRIAVDRNRKLFVRLLERRLSSALPDLELKPRKFALQRVRESEDLVALALAECGVGTNPLLSLMRKHHRTEFIPRLEFVRGRGTVIVLGLQFGIKFKLIGTAADFVAAGADIRHMQVLRNGDYLGRVIDASPSEVSVAGEHGEVRLPLKEVVLEPSMESFTRLFETALRSKATSYMTAERRIVASKLSGLGYVNYVAAVAAHLKKYGDRELAPGISFRFGGLIELASSAGGPSSALPQIEYCFSPDRSATDRVPSNGLERYGPFDGRSFDRKEPHILVVSPQECRSEIEQFVRRLRDGLGGNGSQRFKRGLVGTYRLSRARFSFTDAAPAARTAGKVGAAYVDAMRGQFEGQRPPDAALVVLRDDEAFMPGSENPYLAAKAWLLSQGVPSQDVRLSKTRASQADLPFILEDIALALYAKLGGCPWTVAPSRPLVHEVIFGMAYAEFGERFRSRSRYMGITAVFTSDGSYVMAATSPRCPYDDYPAALADTIRRTVSRLKRDQGWLEGDTVRLVFHSAKPLTKHDITRAVDAAVEELGGEIRVETAVLTILRDHPFTLMAPWEKGRSVPVERFDGTRGWANVGEAAPNRGTCIDLGDSRRLLCVNGPFLIRREGDPLPQPLLIQLHERSGFKDMSALTRQVFQLTGLSWRSVRPASEPVTLQYPRLIAKLIGRLEASTGWSDTLIDTRLVRSRWFL